MKKFISIIFLCTLSCLHAQFENSNETLIKIGEKEISLNEFNAILKFNPRQDIHSSNPENIKNEILYSLIAEKLWAIHAEDLGINLEPDVIAAINSITKMFVRDALYKKMIKDQVTISEEEIQSGSNRFYNRRKVRIFFADNFNEITKLNQKILNDSVKSEDYSEVTFKFGDLEPITENIIFDLKIGTHSGPIKTEAGWYIYKLNGIDTVKITSAKEGIENQEEIIKKIKERKENSLYIDYTKAFLKGKSVDVNPQLFNKLLEKLTLLFNTKRDVFFSNQMQNNKSELEFDSQDVDSVLGEFSQIELKSDFILFNENPIILETFIREFSFNYFSIKPESLDSLEYHFAAKVKEYIKYEILYREGKRQGLENTEEVKFWLNVWKDNFLFQFTKNNFFNSDEFRKKYFSIDVSLNNDKDFYSKKIFDKFTNKTVELANTHKFEINNMLYGTIRPQNVNFVVYRYLGFGGVITGAPSVYTFTEWYKKWQESIKLNP